MSHTVIVETATLRYIAPAYADEKSLNLARRETKDCTVRATAIALDIPYARAHEQLAALGRKPRQGVTYSHCTDKLGLRYRPDLSCCIWRTLAPKLATGRFVVRVAHHVFAVVGGLASEYVKPGKRIKMVYEVPGATLTPTTVETPLASDGQV